MRQVLSLLTLLLIPFTSSTAAEAYIKLQIDSSEVFSGDIVVLDVESTGLLDPLDFSLIEQHATVLRQTTGTRIAVIGGKVQEIDIWRMDLQPKRTGIIVIGPFVSGEVMSNSVHINVLNAKRPQWTPLHDDARIVTTLTPSQPVVHQQVLFTVDLLHRYPINNESFQLPELEGFSSRPVIENRRTYAGENGDWFRTQWKTLIYPRQSGVITIDGIHWSGTMAKSYVERAPFERSTNPLNLIVNGATSNTNEWWLPSRSVTLSESWSSPPTQLRAGDELERAISVTATDVLAGQIPVPEFPQSRGLKHILINTSRKELLKDTTITSTAEFTWRVSALSPIPVFLDTVRLNWWDTNEKAMKEAIIPARRINVGLPERTDVLTKIALDQNPGGRLTHYLQSADPIRMICYFAAGAAALCLFIWYAPSRWRRLAHRLRLNKHIKQLENLASSGDTQQLYHALRTAESNALLRGTQVQLLTRLEQHLFCRDSAAVQDRLAPLEWLQPVARAARCLPPEASQLPPGKLAEL